MLITIRFIQLLSVAFLALVLYQTMVSQVSYWLVLSAFLFTLFNDSAPFKRRLFSILLTALGFVCLALLAALCTSSIILSTLYLFLVLFSAAYFSERYPAYRASSFILILFLVFTFFVANNQLLQGMMFFLIGAMIALILQSMFAWANVKNHWLYAAKMMLKQLAHFNTTIFSCYLDPAYLENIYFHERRLHVEKNDCYFAMERLRQLSALKHASPLFIQKCEKLYEMFVAISQLRYRVSDYTIFEVCKNEMQALHREINKILTTLANHSREALNFYNQVKDFEDLYLNVIQVTAKEPLNFLIFISNLKALNAIFAHWHDS